MAESDDSVIPQQADAAANAANMAAIDRMAGQTRYRYIVAWGKFLGFKPSTVIREIELAQAEGAPLDAVQKIEGRWHTLGDIANDANRSKVEALATKDATRQR